MRTYKAAVSRLARREGHAPLSIWQRNYYEHIIRGQGEWNTIHRYIESNPMLWSQDRENPDSAA